MDIFRDWAATLCVTVIFISVASIILPNNSMKNHIKFAFSLILLAVMVLPITNFLSLGKNLEDIDLDIPVQSTMENESDISNKDIYNNEFLTQNLERTLVNTLKQKYSDKDFEVSIEGKIDIGNIDINIDRVEVGVIDKKKIKKIEKIIIGNEQESMAEQPEEDSLMGEVKKFISDELKIDKNKVRVSYI